MASLTSLNLRIYWNSFQAETQLFCSELLCTACLPRVEFFDTSINMYRNKCFFLLPIAGALYHSCLICMSQSRILLLLCSLSKTPSQVFFSHLNMVHLAALGLGVSPRSHSLEEEVLYRFSWWIYVFRQMLLSFTSYRFVVKPYPEAHITAALLKDHVEFCSLAP